MYRKEDCRLESENVPRELRYLLVPVGNELELIKALQEELADVSRTLEVANMRDKNKDLADNLRLRQRSIIRQLNWWITPKN